MKQFLSPRRNDRRRNPSMRTRIQIRSPPQGRCFVQRPAVFVLFYCFFLIISTNAWVTKPPFFASSNREFQKSIPAWLSVSAARGRCAFSSSAASPTAQPGDDDIPVEGKESDQEATKSVTATITTVGSIEFPVFPSDRGRQQQSSAQELINAAASATQDSCRLLGIKSIGVDYGLVRTGVALTVGYNPKPVAILTDLNATQVSQEVVRFAKAERASRIIVGLPLHKNGTVAEQTNLTLVFAQQLAQYSLRHLGPSVPVHLWDERYTSKEAAARAHSRNPDRILYGTLDADAACIILEQYYCDNGVGALDVSVTGDVRRECVEEFDRRQEHEQACIRATVDEREMKIQRRKDAIARGKKLEEEEREISGVTSNKKKKKKRKR